MLISFAVISQQAIPSPANHATSSMTFNPSPSAQSLLVARQRSFHVRRLNEMNLNQRQRGARRRNLWRREKTTDGQFRWVRDEDCLPPRISILTADAMVRSRASSMADSFADTAYGHPQRSEKTKSRITGDTNETMERREGCIETELTMLDTSPSIRKHKKSINMDTPKALAENGSTANFSQNGTGYINESSVGYVRHVDKHGNIVWVPAESITHEADPIDTTEFPRCSTVIDFEAVAALPFRQKVRWLLQELEKIAISWEDGHLLLKIRRDAVLDESMRLLMLVPASDLRQRLRIEFIEEPGLDAGGLMREWVTLLCEQLFDESYGLFQATHVENLSYWINPNSGQTHPDHLISYQFIGRLIAKCLLEGQLLTVYFALPFLKHLLGVPISFSDLEFLDEELYRSACWLRENSNVDSLCLDFTMQRRDAQGQLITEELKPDGKNIMVNDDNKQEYLELLVKYKMFDTVHEQVNAILQGLYDIIPRTLLAVFDYQELELILCGVPSIDVDDWESHTDVKYQEIDQPSRREKKAVEWFWEVVSSFSQEKRARLLQFATGSSRVPVEGFKALLSSDGRVRRFGIHLVPCGVPPAGLFPQAHTCFNRIDLPIYESKEQLETYLTLVINMEITGFSMQ